MKDYKKLSHCLINITKKALPCALAAILLLLTACTNANSSPSDSELKISLLESRLATLTENNTALKKQQEEDIQAMESKLDELKALIEAVSADPEKESPEEDEKYFGFSYIIEEDGAIITAYGGDATEIIIPASILGHPTLAIADEAFKGSLAVSVSIPETVTRIGWFAFSSCPRLERIVIPKKVTEIGYGAFDSSPLVKVYAPADSYAAKYAKSYGLAVSID